MKIIVLMKQVPASDSALRIDESHSWIYEDNLEFETNESDAYALEAGLQLKERHNGEVVVLSIGPVRVQKMLREALARGADRAIHIEASSLRDPLTIASLAARAIETEHPDFILAGIQSDDLGYGETGVVLAEILGLPHATLVMEIEKTGDQSIRVKRELEGGWFQWVALPLPALLTIQSGITTLRYATLKGIMKAKKKEMRQITASDVDLVKKSMLEIVRCSIPQRTKQTRILGGSTKEAATKLVEILQTEVPVL